jgi:hypothetical protein
MNDIGRGRRSWHRWNENDVGCRFRIGPSPPFAPEASHPFRLVRHNGADRHRGGRLAGIRDLRLRRLPGRQSASAPDRQADAIGQQHGRATREQRNRNGPVQGHRHCRDDCEDQQAGDQSGKKVDQPHGKSAMRHAIIFAGTICAGNVVRLLSLPAARWNRSHRTVASVAERRCSLAYRSRREL